MDPVSQPEDLPAANRIDLATRRFAQNRRSINLSIQSPERIRTMEMLETIRTRRSIRNYTGEPIPR